MITHIIFLLIAYLVGSIPTGYWLAYFLFGIDIQQHGSGNIGATNLGRTLGKKYFFVVMFLDALKAYLTLEAARLYISTELLYLFCVAALLLLGNAHSLFLQFRGGKGVATVLGILAFFVPFWVMLIFGLMWGPIFFITTFAFFASLFAMLFVFFIYLIFFGFTAITFFLVALFFWLVTRHCANIKAFLNR